MAQGPSSGLSPEMGRGKPCHRLQATSQDRPHACRAPECIGRAQNLACPRRTRALIVPISNMPNPSKRPRIFKGFEGILHGGDYNPDQWLGRPEVIDEDFRLMPLAQCNTFSIGIFAWTSYEAEEGKFDFAWLDTIMNRMADAAHNVILATPSGSKPAWLSQKYPEVRRVNAAGLREPHHGRHNHCWTSPVYREKVRRINTELGERYHAHPALRMWHISNEYGGQCYCELCIRSFQTWLERKYGNLHALNQAWWTGFWSHTFTSFAEVDPRDASLDGLRLDFMRFNTWQIADFFEFEAEPLKRLAPEIPCTTNFMGVIQSIDYAALARHVDVISDDQYPFYNPLDPGLTESAAATALRDDLYRCFKPDRPWMLMECCPDAAQWNPPMRLKRPGMHRMEMLQALGHGSEGTCYFQWRKGLGGVEKFHGAVVDHVGHEHTRVFQTVAELGAEYAFLGKILGSELEANVALVYEQEARWGLEFSDGAPSQGDAYVRVFRDHYVAFWERNVCVDIVDSLRDLSKYRLVVLPQLWLLKAGVAENLKRYVSGGGTLVATNCTAICDEYNRCFAGGWPGGGLMDLFGIWEEEFDCVDGASPHERNELEFLEGNTLGLAGRFGTLDVRSLLHLRGADALASFTGDFYAGRPAVTRHTFGRGEAYFIGARAPRDFLCAFYDSLRQSLEIESVVPVRLPSGVSAQKRVSPEREFVFIENFSRQEQHLDLVGLGYVDAITGQVVETLDLFETGSAVLERERRR